MDRIGFTKEEILNDMVKVDSTITKFIDDGDAELLKQDLVQDELEIRNKWDNPNSLAGREAAQQYALQVKEANKCRIIEYIGSYFDDYGKFPAYNSIAKGVGLEKSMVGTIMREIRLEDYLPDYKKHTMEILNKLASMCLSDKGNVEAMKLWFKLAHKVEEQSTPGTINTVLNIRVVPSEYTDNRDAVPISEYEVMNDEANAG